MSNSMKKSNKPQKSPFKIGFPFFLETRFFQTKSHKKTGKTIWLSPRYLKTDRWIDCGQTWVINKDPDGVHPWVHYNKIVKVMFIILPQSLTGIIMNILS